MNSSNKSFGIVFFVVFLLFGLYPLSNEMDVNLYLISISFIFLILGLLNSKILTPLNIAWVKFGFFLGKTISPIVMFFIYFTIVFFTKIVLNIFNKDILNLKINKKSKSYWIKRVNSKPGSMDNQF